MKQNPEGKEIKRVHVFESSSKQGDFADYAVNYMNIDSDGNIYIVDNAKKINVYDSQLKHKFELIGENAAYLELYQLKDGTVGVRTTASKGGYQMRTMPEHSCIRFR